MFNKEAEYITPRRRAAVRALGERHLTHPSNFVERQTPPPITAGRLVKYHNACTPVMQGGLRAFWRTLVSAPHVGQEFERALAILSKEKHHA